MCAVEVGAETLAATIESVRSVNLKTQDCLTANKITAQIETVGKSGMRPRVDEIPRPQLIETKEPATNQKQDSKLALNYNELDEACREEAQNSENKADVQELECPSKSLELVSDIILKSLEFTKTGDGVRENLKTNVNSALAPFSSESSNLENHSLQRATLENSAGAMAAAVSKRDSKNLLNGHAVTEGSLEARRKATLTGESDIKDMNTKDRYVDRTMQNAKEFLVKSEAVECEADLLDAITSSGPGEKRKSRKAAKKQRRKNAKKSCVAYEVLPVKDIDGEEDLRLADMVKESVVSAEAFSRAKRVDCRESEEDDILKGEAEFVDCQRANQPQESALTAPASWLGSARKLFSKTMRSVCELGSARKLFSKTMRSVCELGINFWTALKQWWLKVLGIWDVFSD
ncbi:hypothetical protein HDU97_008446 [Phlyctochytrium planicorne]|nr:hypothetical protein HDU97_008446 [Phlyctochytrium planicorne]